MGGPVCRGGNDTLLGGGAAGAHSVSMTVAFGGADEGADADTSALSLRTSTATSFEAALNAEPSSRSTGSALAGVV